MKLIDARQPKIQEQRREEERFRFPAVEEAWEVSCCLSDDWDAIDALKNERPAVARRLARPAVA
jgi:hypothetical protein